MSVINKMLNDLDQREDTQEAQQEVAFMSQPRKQRPKWLITGIVSIVSCILLIVISYMYYGQVLGLGNQLESISAKNQVDKTETVHQDKTAAVEKPVPDQPKLIVIPKKTADGESAKRKSTLSVAKVATPDKEPSKQQTPVEKSQPEPPLMAKADPEPGDKRQPEVIPPSAIKTSADAPKPKGAPTADSSKMKVSRVKLSAEKRAKKAYDKAKLMAQTGLVKEAIAQYKDVLKFKPDHQVGRAELAALYFGRAMVSESIEVLEQGLSIDPGNSSWSLLAAKIHYKRGDYGSAMEYLQLPLRAFDEVEYVALKATTMQKLKDYRGAEAEYRQLTLAYPDNGRWWLGLGASLEGSQQITAAVSAYRKSLRLSNISQTSRQFVRSRLMRLEN
jgi:MSHA biogenesis protein MshN